LLLSSSRIDRPTAGHSLFQNRKAGHSPAGAGHYIEFLRDEKKVAGRYTLRSCPLCFWSLAPSSMFLVPSMSSRATVPNQYKIAGHYTSRSCPLCFWLLSQSLIVVLPSTSSCAIVQNQHRIAGHYTSRSCPLCFSLD
jgi:hypothetical protein